MVKCEDRKDRLVPGCKDSQMSGREVWIFFPICNKEPLKSFKLVSGVGGKVCAMISFAFLNGHSNSNVQQGSVNFFSKGQIQSVNIFAFTGHTISFATTQLCCYSIIAAITLFTYFNNKTFFTYSETLVSYTFHMSSNITFSCGP